MPISKNLFSFTKGPVTPAKYVPDSPQRVKKTLFPKDDSPISDTDEEDSTARYAAKVTTQSPFKFRKFTKNCNKSTSDVNSSPIQLPSPNASTIIISSDEELENSMLALEEQISLEMSSSD